MPGTVFDDVSTTPTQSGTVFDDLPTAPQQPAQYDPRQRGVKLKGNPDEDFKGSTILPMATAAMIGGPILGEGAALIPGLSRLRSPITVGPGRFVEPPSSALQAILERFLPAPLRNLSRAVRSESTEAQPAGTLRRLQFQNPITPEPHIPSWEGIPSQQMPPPPEVNPIPATTTLSGRVPGPRPGAPPTAPPTRTPLWSGVPQPEMPPPPEVNPIPPPALPSGRVPGSGIPKAPSAGEAAVSTAPTLDEIAQGQYHTSFAKLEKANPDAAQIVRNLHSRIQPAPKSMTPPPEMRPMTPPPAESTGSFLRNSDLNSIGSAIREKWKAGYITKAQAEDIISSPAGVENLRKQLGLPKGRFAESQIPYLRAQVLK